ncbi:MAG TPA: PAS domain S-box protein [Chthoniobacter sp.]|nr:PAS domain S-box protein [Chthoniobacter sp.]
MSSISNNSTFPPRRFGSDAFAYGLVAAFIFVLTGGLWLLWQTDMEWAHVEDRMTAWTQAAETSSELGPILANIYTVGLVPPASGETPAQDPVTEVRKTYEGKFAIVAERVRSLSIAADHDSVLKELDNIQTGAQAMLGLADTLRGSGRSRLNDPVESGRLTEVLRLMEERYGAAAKALQRLQKHEHNFAIELGRERFRLAEKYHNIAYGTGALLLLLFGVSVGSLWCRNRQARSDATGLEAVQKERKEAVQEYRSLFDNAIEGIFQTTPEGRIVTANRAFARMYGYESPEQLMEKVTDVAAQLYVDSNQRQALLEALKVEDVVSNFELEVMRADGRLIWVRENVRAIRDESGRLRYLEGTVEDVSDVWWGEQRRRLQYSLAHVLGDSATVEKARPEIISTICKAMGWDAGIFFQVSGTELQALEMWHVPDLEMEELQMALPHLVYKRGHRLAGEAWAEAEPKWIAELSTELHYANADLLQACGMSAVFAVPIALDGEVQYVLELFSSKIALPDPELLQVLGSISSQLGHLMERKRSEEALRRSEMRKAAILRSALDCIITFDLDGKITEFNPAAERAFGYTAEEAMGRELAELIIPESLRDSHRRGLALYNATTIGPMAGRRMELIAMRADGKEFPVEMSISRIVIDGRPMFTGYMRDISERQEAERITSELAAVVANSNDAIVACTLEGRIVSWNVGAERIYGYSTEEAVGKQLDTLIPPDRLDEFPQALTMVKRGESVANYETIRLRKDGKRISVSLTDSPIRSESGRITGLSSIARDITERKRLEEELLQSQKMDAVGRLAGGIAHDFNNILTAILGYSDLIIGQIDERQWMYKHLSEIRKAADFAASLTHQLLAFSRRQPLFLRVFNINETVKNMQKMLQRVIGEHIQIKTLLKAEIGRLKADPSQLEQVLLNLCVNARDAMPKGGSITIETADVTYFLDDFYSVNEMPAGEYVKLTICDTGTGMTAEVKKHIFEPFFTTKEKGQGTGLGLATCYGIVKQSGGYITVDSHVDVGTTFSIYLPRVDESGEKSSIRKEVGHLPGGHETVLYVEDEITVRSLTAHVLRRLGYTVLEAASGKQARDAIENYNGRDVHLLFSDVVLPDAGGKELADWIRETRSGRTKLLFTSGYVDESILRRHGVEGGTAFLQKPFTPADLARKVREVLDSTED